MKKDYTDFEIASILDKMMDEKLDKKSIVAWFVFRGISFDRLTRVINNKVRILQYNLN